VKIPNSKRTSVILTAIAVGLWIHSIVFADFRIGFYGLIDSFPITLFVGLGFLTIASAILWLSKEYHPKLLVTQLVLLISALWLAPAIADGSAPFANHALRSLGLVEYIARTGNMTASELAYLSWPGAFVIPALISKTFSVSFESMLNYAPFGMRLLYILPLYIFLRNTLGKDKRNYIWVGMWLFFLASWTGDAYFASTAGVAFLLLLILVALITTPLLWERGIKSHPVLIASIVAVFGFLSITHLLTSLVALSIMAGIVLLKRNRRVFLVVGLCLGLLVTWNLTGALGATRLTIAHLDIISPTGVVGKIPPEELPLDIVLLPDDEVSIEPTVPSKSTDPTETIEPDAGGSIVEKSGGFIGEVIELPSKPIQLPGRTIIFIPAVLVEGQIGAYLAGSESHSAVSKVRLLFSMMFAIIGLSGVVVSCRDKKERSIALFVLVMALAPLILIFVPYGGRMVLKLYFVSLIPMAYFGARLWETRKKAVVVGLCLFLIVSGPLHIVAHYGNQEYDYISSDQMEGLEYFHNNTSGGYVIGLEQPWLMRNLEKYHSLPFHSLRWNEGEIKVSMSRGVKPTYLIITRQDRVFYEFLVNAPQFVGEVEELLVNTRNCELVYDNPDFRYYLIESE